MNKLKKDIHAMRLFSLLLPKENREQLKGLSTQVSEIVKAIDDYIGFFSEKGWCAYDSLNITMVKKAVAEAKKDGIEAGERIILSFYLNDVKEITHWLKNKGSMQNSV